jgi:ABC-type Fe3+ transport system permease subunit
VFRFPALSFGCTLAVIVAPVGAAFELHARAFSMPGLWRLVAQDVSPLLAFRTLELCLLTALFSGFLGIPAAWLLARGPRRGRVNWAALVMVPLGVPPILAAAPFFSLGNVAASVWVCAFALSLCFFPVVAIGVSAALEKRARR